MSRNLCLSQLQLFVKILPHVPNGMLLHWNSIAEFRELFQRQMMKNSGFICSAFLGIAFHQFQGGGCAVESEYQQLRLLRSPFLLHQSNPIPLGAQDGL